MILNFTLVKPEQIIVKRDTRQRQENIGNVDDLVESIKQVGILNPLIVTQTEEGLVLVAGERRHKAATALGLETVPIRFIENLSHAEAEVIELEENLKRVDLTWKDQVRSIGRLHQIYKSKDESWKIEQTAEAVSLHHSYLRKILHVHAALETGKLDKAESIEQAYNTIQRVAERKAESIVSSLIVTGATLFGEKPSEAAGQAMAVNTAAPPAPAGMAGLLSGAIPTPAPISQPATPIPTPAAAPSAPTTFVAPLPPPTPSSDQPIICANFLEWAKTYSGPKFTLVHCDFPYGNYKGNDSKGAMSALDTDDFYDNTEDVYWTLLDGLCANLDRIMSYSAYLVFWFNMNFYTETVKRLRAVGLTVHDHPLIWHKTGGPGGLGVAPGTEATHPRRTYDTALMAVRGKRPLVRTMCNSYAAPTVGNKIHPSQKPEPMLRYFLQMFVDETASVLDPTCGSAAALRAAEDLGAKHILGIEMDPNYAATANTKTLQARILRQAGSLRKEEN